MGWCQLKNTVAFIGSTHGYDFYSTNSYVQLKREKKMVELTYVPVQDLSLKITEWRFVLKFNMAVVVTVKSTAVQCIFLVGEKKSIHLK